MNAGGGRLMFIYQKYQMRDKRWGEMKGTENIIILLLASVCAGNLKFLQDTDRRERCQN